jgi:hypothetical protein
MFELSTWNRSAQNWLKIGSGRNVLENHSWYCYTLSKIPTASEPVFCPHLGRSNRIWAGFGPPTQNWRAYHDVLSMESKSFTRILLCCEALGYNNIRNSYQVYFILSRFGPVLGQSTEPVLHVIWVAIRDTSCVYCAKVGMHPQVHFKFGSCILTRTHKDIEFHKSIYGKRATICQKGWKEKVVGLIRISGTTAPVERKGWGTLPMQKVEDALQGSL